MNLTYVISNDDNMDTNLNKKCGEVHMRGANNSGMKKGFELLCMQKSYYTIDIIMPNGESHPRNVVPESFLVGKNKLVNDITTEKIMLIQHETIHIHLQLNA